MWFGNLVTMQWWDDLWLNESFATWMSHMCLADAKGLEAYTLSWELFVADKKWGMRTDMFASTHPIAAACHTTEDADRIFDGISYGKGASTMKQLCHFIGEDAFRVGIKHYFATYPYQNTVLQNLIDSLQLGCDQSGKKVNLNEWSDTWVKKSGINIIKPKFTVENGLITSFTLHQSCHKNGDKILRKQNIDIAGFNNDLNELWVISVDILDTEVTSVDCLIGMPAPEGVLVNWNDWGYGLFEIDEKSLNLFKAKLSNIKNNLARNMIYSTVFQMVKDGQLPPQDYITLVKNHIETEQSQEVFTTQISQQIPMVLSYFVPLEFQAKEKDDMFSFLLNTLYPKYEGNEEMREIIVDAIISCSSSLTNISLIAKWLTQENFTLSPEQKN